MNSDEKVVVPKCERSECDKEASVRCPICAKAGVLSSLYCSQECFNLNWKDHKKFHFFLKKPAEDNGGYVPWPDFQFTGKIRPFPKGPQRVVPGHIKVPDYANHPKGLPLSEIEQKKNTTIRILNKDEIKAMRVACKLGREVLDEAAKAIRVGVTTEEIDRVVFDACIERDCYPSPLRYYEFYASCCTSVNEVICHGVPDQRELQDGDICNVDVTVFHNGFHGDLNETFFVGEVSKPHKKLVNVTYECLMKAMKLVKPGTPYRQLGNIIQKHASANGFGVVRSYCGHGIHELFHTAPNVPHFANNKAIGVMKPGHCFTIEPMLTEGNWRDKCWPDNWTVVTEDGSWSAQFEHTILVTDTGYDILTKRQNEFGLPHFLD